MRRWMKHRVASDLQMRKKCEAGALSRLTFLEMDPPLVWLEDVSAGDPRVPQRAHNGPSGAHE